MERAMDVMNSAFTLTCPPDMKTKINALRSFLREPV